MTVTSAWDRPCSHAFHVFEQHDVVHGEAMEPQLLRLHVLELPKTAGLDPGQEAWRRFLRTGRVGPGASGPLMEAASMLVEANLTCEEKAMIDYLEKALADHEAELAWARNRGLEQGLKKGRAEGRAEVARRALAAGVDRATVAVFTGLSETVLAELEAR
jgi:predicted transposase/invertase (TIGR01784 family)